GDRRAQLEGPPLLVAAEAEEHVGVLAHLEVGTEHHLAPQVGQLGERGQRHHQRVAHAGALDDHAIERLLDQGAAQLDDHRPTPHRDARPRPARASSCRAPSWWAWQMATARASEASLRGVTRRPSSALTTIPTLSLRA